MPAVRAEATKVRLSKEVARRRAIKTSQRGEAIASDERETKPSGRALPPPRQSRRDRVAPETPMMADSKNGADRPKRRKSKSLKLLKVDVNAGDDGEWASASTPRTAASTPSPSSSLRGNSDLRSPGQRKTPTAAKASKDESIPDFITQTDQFGNATTPRSPTAIEKARQIHPSGAKPHLHVGPDGKLTEADDKDSDVDACAETLLDSLRLMCCCLMPDEGQSGVKSQETEEEELPPEASDRPRLLPKLHPEDHGKKCLVLDLDETLVHSSFRAVPGADFVIPVQVRWMD